MLGGFILFCNWNLNTLSKDDFHRITLLEAYNANHGYDIISLCETSLNDTIQIPENILPGYKFQSCNHPDRNGGVGIFYKETLPLRIRHDLSFDECIVSELVFGRKKSSLQYCIGTHRITPILVNLILLLKTLKIYTYK